MNVIKNATEYDAILKDNEKVFVDFYVDWCGPCKMVGPVVEQLSNEISDVAFVKVNVDEHPQIAQRYGVMSIPTMIAFKNGQAVKTTVGFKPKEALEEMIQSL